MTQKSKQFFIGRWRERYFNSWLNGQTMDKFLKKKKTDINYLLMISKTALRTICCDLILKFVEGNFKM